MVWVFSTKTLILQQMLYLNSKYKIDFGLVNRNKIANSYFGSHGPWSIPHYICRSTINQCWLMDSVLKANCLPISHFEQMKNNQGVQISKWSLTTNRNCIITSFLYEFHQPVNIKQLKRTAKKFVIHLVILSKDDKTMSWKR